MCAPYYLGMDFICQNVQQEALWFQKVLRVTRGVAMAADIIERVFGADTSVGSSRPKNDTDVERIKCEPQFICQYQYGSSTRK